MTAVALDILDNDPDGFFLMVEGGRIDHAAHANDLQRTVQEVLEFSRAVQTAMDWIATAAALDTLVLVTADHETGGLLVEGDNGPGMYPDLTWATTGHTAAQVPIYGWGADAWLISPLMDNTDVYAIMTSVPNIIPVPRAMGLAVIGAGFVVLRRRRRCVK
jgi:alkaline phosphatase